MIPERPFPCGALIKCLAEMLDRNANNNLATCGVTFSQMKLLAMLHETDTDSVTMKEIEKYFDLSQPTVAGIVSRLEEKRLVVGFKDPDDRRIKRVSITDKGRQTCEESKCEMTGYENWFMKSLNGDERAELLRLLTKIYEDVA